MLLADQGADVIKVEPLSANGDIVRIPAFDKGGLGAFYLNNNRGKRSLALDLTGDEGTRIMLDLCKDADVFVQNFRPGAIERLGLGYDAVKAVNPDIVYVSISGFGPTGPYSDRPVLDPVIQALCAVVDRQVNPEIPFPDLIRNLFADKSTALTVSQAICAALFARERGAGGQLIEVPMVDACMYFFWPDGMMDKTVIDDDANGGLRLAQIYNLTECSDGKIVYFAASDPQRAGVFAACGHPEWGEDERFSTMQALAQNPENFQILGGMIADAFREMTVADAVAALVEADVPAGPILTAEEAIEDPQIQHNGTLMTWQHPDAGTIQQPVPAARFEKTPAAAGELGAHRGQHTHEILASLGHSPDDIAALHNAGVI